MNASERGFTLIEVTIGAAIAAVVMWSLVAFAARTAASARLLAARGDAQARADRLSERLASEAASAWAIFVPPTDVTGASNADGHELDLFGEDAGHRAYAFAYRYDAATHTLARYAYAPGRAAVETDLLGGYDAVSAVAYPASALADPASPAYDPLFAGVHAPDVAHAFTALPIARGGNGVVLLHLRAAGVERDDVLASGSAPTAFTVVIAYTPSPAPTPTAPAPLPTLTAAPTATP